MQILHYAVIDYSSNFYGELLEKGYELFSKNDLKFIEYVYKLLVKEFAYKPAITLNQFFSSQFLEHKIAFTCDVIEIIVQRHTAAQKCEALKEKQSLPVSATAKSPL